jgi:regulator of cell morphogenesis and NO signaling
MGVPCPGGNRENESWRTAKLQELIHHLKSVHRRWLEEELPGIDLLLDRAADSPAPPETIAALRRAFTRLWHELETHIRNEENVLFPAIVELERRAESGEPAPRAAFGSIRHPIAILEREHETEAVLFQQLRRISAGYAPPQNAPETLQLLYGALKSLEMAEQRHSYLEDDILFQRAVQLEADSRGERPGLPA